MKRGLFWAGIVTAVILAGLVILAGTNFALAPSGESSEPDVPTPTRTIAAPDPTAALETPSAADPPARSPIVPAPKPTATREVKPTPDPTATAETALTPDPTTKRETVPTAKRDFLPSVSKQPTPTRAGTPQDPFYGMVFVPEDQFGLMKEFGVEVVQLRFDHAGTPSDWLSLLNKAQAYDLKVIAWLWPEGWSWDGSAWRIDDQARSFVQTVAPHAATVAVYALHEPYWKGCWGCGYTTRQQQQLYDAIKAIADVPIYSEVGGVAFWTAQGEETAFAERVCDYCGNWYYPFRDGKYQRDILVQRLQDDVAVMRQRSPNSKLVWGLQAFAQDPPGYDMPNADEMYDVANIAYAAGVDGASWYPWTLGELYDDVLSNHPELYDVVRQVYDEIVLPRQQGME